MEKQFVASLYKKNSSTATTTTKKLSHPFSPLSLKFHPAFSSSPCFPLPSSALHVNNDDDEEYHQEDEDESDGYHQHGGMRRDREGPGIGSFLPRARGVAGKSVPRTPRQCQKGGFIAEIDCCIPGFPTAPATWRVYCSYKVTQG